MGAPNTVGVDRYWEISQGCARVHFRNGRGIILKACQDLYGLKPEQGMCIYVPGWSQVARVGKCVLGKNSGELPSSFILSILL